jgi:hypothetical protein
MMIPTDNRLPQPPNAAWHEIASERVPVGEQVVFTDAAKAFVWIGSVSNAETAPPSLAAIGMMTEVKSPAFWSHVADQV